MPWLGGVGGSCCPSADGKPKGKEVAPINPKTWKIKGGGGKKGEKKEPGGSGMRGAVGRTPWCGEGRMSCGVSAVPSAVPSAVLSGGRAPGCPVG